MNIFVLDDDPKLAAQYHCDQHVVKMPTETAQMLSFILRHYGDQNDLLMNFNKAHFKHPCTKWAMRSKENFVWLAKFGMHLYDEYQFRYNKPDKHQRAKNIFQYALDHTPDLPSLGITTFAQAMPETYMHPDVVHAYRTYYNSEKTKFARYNNGRNKPSWL